MSCVRKTTFKFPDRPAHPLKGIVGKLERAGVDTAQRDGESVLAYMVRMQEAISRVGSDPRFNLH